MGLPAHAAFKVAVQYGEKSGITSPEASVKYGPTTRNPMLRFRDAILLFTDQRLYDAYYKEIELARPVHTAMKVIDLRAPLGDFLTMDGKQTYVKIKDGNFTELIQVDDRLITYENLRKPQQLIKAECNWQTSGNKWEFVTRMLEENDQMTIDAPEKGWNGLSRIPGFLFNEKELREGTLVQEFITEYKRAQMNVIIQHIDYKPVEVAGGLASVGWDYYRFHFDASQYVIIPHQIDICQGVLVYSFDGGAKLDEASRQGNE